MDDDEIESNNSKKLDELWNQVWQCQRRLPTYGLQEYCDDKHFHPVPSFKQEPKRSCLLKDNIPLDLDSIPFKAALIKIAFRCQPCEWQFPIEGELHDNLAIERLCETRRGELENTIKMLMLPLSSEDSESSEKNSPHL